MILERRKGHNNVIIIDCQDVSHPKTERYILSYAIISVCTVRVLVCKADIYVRFLRENVNSRTFFFSPYQPQLIGLCAVMTRNIVVPSLIIKTDV